MVDGMNVQKYDNRLSHLRPRRLGELIDFTVRLYRQNFLSFVGVIALVLIPITLVQLLILLPSMGTQSPYIPGSVFGIFQGSNTDVFTNCFLIFLNFALVQVLANAALTHMTAQSYLGQTGGIIYSYKKAKDVWWRLAFSLIGLGIITFIIFLASVMIPYLGWLFGVVIAWGGSIFILTVIIPFMIPVIVLERQTITSAIKRSWDLTRRRFWWVLGYVLVLYMFGQFVIAGPVGLLNIMMAFLFENSATFFMIQIIIQSLAQLIFSLLYRPLQLAAITLLYFDLCISTEGLDLALYSQSVTSTDEYISTIPNLSPQPVNGSWLTGAEVGKFFVIGMGIVVLYVVLLGVGFVLMAWINPFS